MCRNVSIFVQLPSYVPTASDTDEAVEEAYELPNVPLLSRVRDGAVPLLGGDFNACNYWKAS